MSLVGDNVDYDCLKQAALSVRNLRGLSCEIGVRAGGSSKIIVDALLEGSGPVMHIAVDPYGQIPHHSSDEWLHHTNSYNNKMKLEFLRDFSNYAIEKDFDFMFFQLEDYEFIKRFSDGVPVYRMLKTLMNSYRLVFLDGPHDTDSVMNEVRFFGDRIVEGGSLVIDNVGNHNHGRVELALREKGFKGFKIGAGGHQIAYTRVFENPQQRFRRQ